MQITTLKSICNTYSHHDEQHNIIGHTNPNPLSHGEYVHIDTNGDLVGYCKRSLGGGYLHYDVDMNYIGRSDKNPLGGYVHYNSNGELAGVSNCDFFGNFVSFDIGLKIF